MFLNTALRVVPTWLNVDQSFAIYTEMTTNTGKPKTYFFIINSKILSKKKHFIFVGTDNESGSSWHIKAISEDSNKFKRRLVIHSE